MWWAYWIHVYIYQIYEYFWATGDELYTLPWPLSYFALPFWGIGIRFHKLAGYFGEFRKWTEATELIIKTVWTWAGIKKLILEWLPDLEEWIAWFSDWWTSVKVKVEEWWEPKLNFLRGLIAIAVQGLDDLIEAWDTFRNITWPELTGKLSELRSLWDTFWKVTLPTLISQVDLETWWNSRLKDIDKLIDSTIKEWFPFYDDLVSLWGDIATFFTSPLDWLEVKFTDWFLGPEG